MNKDMKTIELLGRILFSQIFIISSFGHFKQKTINHAASHGVLFPEFMVPAAGVLALLGGLSILSGVKARWGALGIVLFLIPVTFIMHNFWSQSDPMQYMLQKTMFMKNLGMLGGALIITYFGAGPISYDGRKAMNIST